MPRRVSNKHGLTLVCRRGLAFLTDCLLYPLLCMLILQLLLIFPLIADFEQGGMESILTVLYLGLPVAIAIQLQFLLSSGKTLGKFLWKLRVVNAENGQTLSRSKVLVRELVAFGLLIIGSIVTLALNIILVLQDAEQRRSLCDRIMKTQIIDACRLG